MSKLHLDGVASTAILTLRARAEEHRRNDRLFGDPDADAWLNRLEWPASLSPWYGRYTQGFLSYRAYEIDQIALDFLDQTPDNAAPQIVELGVGLSTRTARILRAQDEEQTAPPRRANNQGDRAPGRKLTFVDLDLPAIVDARYQLGAYAHAVPYCAQIPLAQSVTDLAWIEHPALNPEAPILFIAEGLFYYLPESDVHGILDALRARFPNAPLVFDVMGMLEFRGARRLSTRAGAPIQWMLPPPFESVFARFRLEPLPGWPSSRLLERALDLCWSRFGRTPAFLARTMANIPSLREGRSGIVAARLCE
ncbi:MAG: class I SAM-dependent methyltransferase [Deltaproteobacteria bacterium]|nr:class I SAM-dependent methyltransferase [Deltaproteobacteria bacterium]